MNKTEMMILSALAKGSSIKDYQHHNNELHNLHKLGYIHCHFDEQNKLISGYITPQGRVFLNKSL